MKARVESGALISGVDFCYRYRLWRIWRRSLPLALWIMLNPSTANASKDDPTVKRCWAFTQRWGYGGFVVVNLFALRSPHPRDLRKHPNPIGPYNDEWIMYAARKAQLVVAAWGTGGWYLGRDEQVRDRLRREGIGLYALGWTQDNHPKHPLARGKHRIPDSAQPILWT